MNWLSIPKLFILAGLVLILLGLIWNLSGSLGRLPGDIRIEKDNFNFYFPLTTSLVLSFVLSAIVWLYNHFTR